MIFKGFSTYLRFSARNIFRVVGHDTTRAYFLISKISFHQSTQQPIINEQIKKKRPAKKSRTQQQDYNKKKSRENTQQQTGEQNQQSLARLIRYYRTRMEKTEDKIAEVTHHSKKIADYYKKLNHSQFVEQKHQIEAILQTIGLLDFTKIQLSQYLCLLDFLRICSSLESLNYAIFLRAQQKIFGLLKNFEKNIEFLSLQQLSTLYCKVNPVYHPQAFTISGLLHDKLASTLQESKTIGLSIMQMFVIIRSMSKKQFLSFPDKKILEILLLVIDKMKINKDKTIVIQLAVALKDLQIEANISDIKICEICWRIQKKAVQIASKGLDSSQVQYLIWSKKSQNPYFLQIFEILAKNTLEQVCNEEFPSSSFTFRRFIGLVKQLPSSYRFQLQQKQKIVKFYERYLQKNPTEDKRIMQIQLLSLIRANFFDQDLSLLDPLFQSKIIDFIWSFPFEYGRRGIPFPLEVLSSKISQNTSKFRLQTNNIKAIVAIALQAKLHPQSELLLKCYNQTITTVKNYSWSISQLSNLIKFAVFDPYLIQKFHQQYHQQYLPSLIPTASQIKQQREIKKGDRSNLLKFWEYIMIQNDAPYKLVSKIPLYAIYLTAFREKKIKNQEIHPKTVLLQAINAKLSSGKIKFADHDSSHVIDLLISYSSFIDYQNQYLCEVYWSCVNYLIDQYGYLRKTIIPYANCLISKLLHIQNSQIRHSIYYKNFVMELIKAVGLLSISNSHDYLKTSIIREGIHNNLISDLNLPQLELAFFSDHEKDMLDASSGKLDKIQYNPQNLIIFFRLPKLPEWAVQDLQKILQVIESSSAQDLSKYLIHYSFQQSSLGEKILNKTCEKLIEKLDITVIDVMSLLRNLIQLSNSHFKLFENVLTAICERLLQKPSLVFLADHYQILKILHQHNISSQNYEHALWEYTKKKSQKSSVYVDIMLELNRNKQEIQFSTADIEQAEKFLLSNPQELLKLMVYQEESIQNMKQKMKQILQYISIPIENSLFLAYLQSKYELVLAKSKVNNSVLSKANFTASKLLRLLEQQGINIKLDERQGQYIYHINENVILVFMKQSSMNECKVASKMLQHLYPKQEIIEINAQGGIKDNEEILNHLHIVNGQIFNSGLIDKLKTDLQMG